MSVIDPDLLASLQEELREYLPSIVESVDALKSGDTSSSRLEVLHRLAHSIKGASAMVKLTTLSRLGLLIEDAAEDLLNGAYAWNEATERAIEAGLEQIFIRIEEPLQPAEADAAALQHVESLFVQWRGSAGEESGAAPADTARASAASAAFPGVTSSLAPAVAYQPDRLANVPEELLEIFLQEAAQHLQTVASHLREYGESTDNAGRQELLREVRRSVHTLKSAAGMVGLKTTGKLAHVMEDLLDWLAEHEMEPTQELMKLLLRTSDLLEDLVAERADTAALNELFALYASLELGGVPTAAAATPDTQEAVAAAEQQEQEATREDLARKQGQFVRVPIERLNELTRLVAELLVERSTFEQHLAAYRAEVTELQTTATRVKRIANKLETEYAVSALQESAAYTSIFGRAGGGGRVREQAPGRAGFDSLEFDRYTEFHLLSRDLTEASGDLTTGSSRLQDLSAEFTTHVARLGSWTTEAQDRITRLRLVPFSTMTNRLHRVVRQTADARNKLITLFIDGETTDLDKSVLEEMVGPLEHMLRNACDHGIETPEARRAAGKPERGTIRIRVLYEGTSALIEMTDDGGGINHAKLRQAVIDQGYATAERAAAMSDRDVVAFVFESGLSTADQVSEISGRGIGLDVLRSTVEKLRGTVEVRTERGAGTTFSIRLPMTLGIVRVLLVRAGDAVLAVPQRAVRQVLRLDLDQLAVQGELDFLKTSGGGVVPLQHLATSLGLAPAIRAMDALGTDRRVPVLLLSLGDRQLALMVDRLLEAREVVVKTFGPLLGRVKGLTGATVLGDGSVVPIVNPSELGGQGAISVHRSAPEVDRRTLEVLVVDDSLSVRRVVSNLLRSVGWTVYTAKDGLDALETLQKMERAPDCVLLDVEMPRMDGFELTATLRRQSQYKRLPIVMLTSRSGAKHRAKAAELGATDYLVKPYHDDQMLATIRRVVNESRVPIQ